MADETLIDSALRELGPRLLDPFESACVKGASYDVRVGEAAQVAATDGGHHWIKLGGYPFAKEVVIPPGATCTIQSLEKVHIATDMKGRLALRAFHAKRLIFFAGGVIDPGYDDHLFLPVVNLSDIPVKVEYGEKLVSAEFIRIGNHAQAYQPPPEPVTAEPQPVVALDRARLSSSIREHEAAIAEMQKRLTQTEIGLGASKSILEWVVLAAVVGGAVGITTSLVPKLTSPWSEVVFVVVGVLGVLALGLIWRRFHPAK